MAAERTTPLAESHAAQLASRSTTRSWPHKQPRRGEWLFWEKRTIFMWSLLGVPVGGGVPRAAF